ncbi:flocculation protein FLO11-like [Pieris napi]|uniref:flocculation protein FLO11-like n=1 Tax=Pieris napi TaxID=78633 RepID=UPI001FB98167|nr:flocculation protein FLO11-like [Pieris napi]XP_047508493.1 flocculation protein FLO11-like [Pieris napi]XP_047508495.1 flocculation protein FLO11-like [Pieris napi]XP_047508496.1 flocculation protein FLO11-like [Pieris napi]XP_047508497.1 flocculation protein FLO11-like [Pieris napi]
MDKEAKQNKQQKAASTDAPVTNKPRVASQDVSRCKSPVTRYSDAPVSQADAPIRAASKTPKEREAAGDAPNRAVPLTVPPPMKSQTPPHKEVSTVAARFSASVQPKMVTLKDATAMSASVGGASAARTMRKTEAATESTSSAPTSTMDMSALKTAIQEPTLTIVLSASKRRRLKKAKRASEQQMLDTDAQKLPKNPKPAPAAPTAAGGGKRAPKPTRSTAALKPCGSKCSRRSRVPNSNKTNKQTKGQKRDRPEETMTPTGESKRVKPNKPRLEAGTSASYAKAAAFYKANKLCVAVMTEPFVNMSKEQADNIRLQIEGKIRDELMADLEATLITEPNDIRFRGRAHFSEGVLKTWCEDTFTLDWLTRTCDVITNPIPDTRLVVRPQSDIPKKFRVY